MEACGFDGFCFGFGFGSSRFAVGLLISIFSQPRHRSVHIPHDR
jgi:hypothetical protein